MCRNQETTRTKLEQIHSRPKKTQANRGHNKGHLCRPIPHRVEVIAPLRLGSCARSAEISCAVNGKQSQTKVEKVSEILGSLHSLIGSAGSNGSSSSSSSGRSSAVNTRAELGRIIMGAFPFCSVAAHLFSRRRRPAGVEVEVEVSCCDNGLETFSRTSSSSSGCSWRVWSTSESLVGNFVPHGSQRLMLCNPCNVRLCRQKLACRYGWVSRKLLQINEFSRNMQCFC